jgi:hypothetical protein
MHGFAIGWRTGSHTFPTPLELRCLSGRREALLEPVDWSMRIDEDVGRIDVEYSGSFWIYKLQVAATRSANTKWSFGGLEGVTARELEIAGLRILPAAIAPLSCRSIFVEEGLDGTVSFSPSLHSSSWHTHRCVLNLQI